MGTTFPGHAGAVGWKYSSGLVISPQNPALIDDPETGVDKTCRAAGLLPEFHSLILHRRCRPGVQEVAVV